MSNRRSEGRQLIVHEIRGLSLFEHLCVALFASFKQVADAVIGRGGFLVVEWPAKSRHWKDPRVKDMMALDGVRWESGVLYIAQKISRHMGVQKDVVTQRWYERNYR